MATILVLKPLISLLYLGTFLFPTNVPQTPEISYKVNTIPMVKTIDTPKLETVDAVAPIAPPAPPSVPTPVINNNCTTYFSGDVYLDNIIRFESSGNSCASNAGGCFGLLQACPGAPLRAACGGDPLCQIRWFQANKTGGRSWAQVWQHELAYGWW